MSERPSPTVEEWLIMGYKVEDEGFTSFPSLPGTVFEFVILTKGNTHLAIWLRNESTHDEWKTGECTKDSFVRGEDRIPHGTFDDYVACFTSCIRLSADATGFEESDFSVDLVRGSSVPGWCLTFKLRFALLPRMWTVTFPFELHVCPPAHRCGVKRERTALEETAVQTAVRIPDDVKWFIPDMEGWLCDYEYVRSASGSLKMLLIPRGSGLGKIQVYDRHYWELGRQQRPFKGDPNKFLGFMWQNFKFWSQATIQQRWLAVAMNQWGDIQYVFATFAHFGDTKAFTGIPASLPLDAHIPLLDIGKDFKGPSSKISTLAFPGITGTNETFCGLN